MIDKKILDDIRNNRCVLFLGPLMTAVRYKGKRTSLTELFCAHITQTLVTENVIKSDSGAQKNPYYVMAKYINYLGGRNRFDEEFASINKKFFERPSSVYYLLSKIPFNTIINFGSDHLMEEALRKGGYEFYSAHYDYNGEYQQYLKGLDDKTQLVYNLLGSIYVTQSQVLTENDQLEYMKKIAGVKKIPDNVLSRIKDDADGKSYIFLGFNFEEWPFRFLLDILQLPKVKSSASPQLRGYNIALMTQEFYQERFGLQFINSVPEDFARELITEYRNGRMNHKNGYISYHKDDEEFVKSFNDHLNPSGLTKRINFWDKSQVDIGTITQEEISKNFAASTVYIPFITNRFLNDPALKQEMQTMLSKPNVLIFPIIAKICQYEYVFPELKRKASLILPGADSVLKSSTKEPGDEDYIAIIKKINSKIR